MSTVLEHSISQTSVGIKPPSDNFIHYIPSKYIRSTKRSFDVVSSVVLLIILTPTLGLVSFILTLIDNGFPIFFIQERVGENGRYFKCIKFRSLPKNSKSAVQASKLGLMMRRYHLDEIPQIINVLKGNMSLVGPRPHMISDDLRFSELNASYSFRHKIKPGITGWAQCQGYYGLVDSLEHLNKRTQLDLEYLTKASLWLDLKILYKTLRLHV